MGITAITVTREVSHPNFVSVAHLIRYLEDHYRLSPHSLTVYAYFADLHFIARGAPHGTNILQYYNPCHCVTLRKFPDMEELLALAKERFRKGEIPKDWRERLIDAMRTADQGTTASVP
jgi:hypothetical protein